MPQAFRPLRAALPVGWALLTGLVLGTGCTPVRIGAPGDESPLTGATRNLQPTPLRPAWRRVLSDSPSQKSRRESAGVAYASGEDRACVGAARGWFYCFRASSGALLWRTQIDASATGQAVFDRGQILVGTDDGRILALDGDGDELWDYKTRGAVIQKPVVSGKTVYFVDGSNALYAVDRTTGAWKWQYRREQPAKFALVGESRPAVKDGRVHVGFSDGVFVTLDAKDGAVLWTQDLAPEHDKFEDADAAPVVYKGTVYAASSAGGIYALDAKTGAVAWVRKTTGVTHLLDAGGGELIYAADNGTISRIRMSDGQTIWRAKLKGGQPGEPARMGRYIVVTMSNAGLHLLDAETGRPLQRFVPGNGLFAPATVHRNGSVFMLSNGGVLYALRTPKPKPPKR